MNDGKKFSKKTQLNIIEEVVGSLKILARCQSFKKVKKRKTEIFSYQHNKVYVLNEFTLLCIESKEWNANEKSIDFFL